MKRDLFIGLLLCLAYGVIAVLHPIAPMLAGWLLGRSLGKQGRTYLSDYIWQVIILSLAISISSMAVFHWTGLSDSKAFGWGCAVLLSILGSCELKIRQVARLSPYLKKAVV